jgi:proline dehydrogenase
VLGKRMFVGMMKQTFYGHFVAGEDESTIKPLIMENRRFGVKSILDYSAEKDITHEDAVEAEIT